MDMIAAQLDDAQARFTAIWPGHHGDSTASQSPGAQPAAAQASPAQGRQGPGDRAKNCRWW